jgi:carbon storage regulator
MLVLTRQVEEEILIGDDIRIKIVALNGSQVRIGVEAPRELRVLRKEVQGEVIRQNEAAAQATPEALRRLVQTTSGPVGG